MLLYVALEQYEFNKKYLPHEGFAPATALILYCAPTSVCSVFTQAGPTADMPLASTYTRS